MGSDFMLEYKKGLWNLALYLGEAAEARMLGDSLQESPEGPMCEPGKEKHRLYWRTQDVGAARVT